MVCASPVPPSQQVKIQLSFLLLISLVGIDPGLIAKGQYTHDNGDGDEDHRQAQ
jgi:hypothetical protein